MIIHPEIITTPDLPTIRFRESEDNVDLEKELPVILMTQGWGCGTYFNVQFVNHDRDELLSSLHYVVTQAREVCVTNDADPYKPMTKTVTLRKAEQLSRWDKRQEATMRWNVGRGLHEVLVDDKVVYGTKDKSMAVRIVKGKIPIPANVQ